MKETANLFKALSDITRLRILSLLGSGEELCVCDLMTILELPQSTVSRHLAYLRNNGLVTDRRQGVWMHYKITDHEGLRKSLLNAVDLHLQDDSQAIDDRQKLAVYLKTKDPGACQ